MSAKSRVTAAFLAAPLAPVLLYLIFSAWGSAWVIALPVSLAISYAHLMIAFPAFVWLRSTNRLSSLSVISMAALVAVIPIGWVIIAGAAAALLANAPRARGLAWMDLTDAGSTLLWAAMLGLAAGVTWRLIAGNPANYQLERTRS